MNIRDKNIILFDGVCNFCNASVNFVIKHDRKNSFKFAPLQSEISKNLIPTLSNRVPPVASAVAQGEEEKNAEFKTIIYLERGVLYTRSTALLKILKKLGGIYSLAYIFIFVPRFLRDLIYDLVAGSRYKWFGKRERCMVPTAEVRGKFID